MGHARAPPLPPAWSTLQGPMLDALLSEPRRTFVELLEFDGEDMRGRPLTFPIATERALVPLLRGRVRDRRRRGELDPQPAVGVPGAVRRAQALRYDALAAERGRRAVIDDRALGLVVGIEGNTRRRAAQQPRQNLSPRETEIALALHSPRTRGVNAPDRVPVRALTEQDVLSSSSGSDRFHYLDAHRLRELGR
jgi:hypothetical protein